MDDKQKKDSKIEGEGSYSGTRAYNEATAKFLKKGKVDVALLLVCASSGYGRARYFSNLRAKSSSTTRLARLSLFGRAA